MSLKERIIFTVKPSVIPYLLIIIFALLSGAVLALIIYPISQLLTFLILIVVILISIIEYLSWNTTKYILTDYKVSYTSGILGQQTQFLENKKISSVEVHQSLLNEFANIGNVVVEGDSPDARFTLKYISLPKHYCKLIIDQTKKS